MKVLIKFGQKGFLHNYYIFRNSKKSLRISDADFPTINPNDLLMIAAHLKGKYDSETSIGAFTIALNFLKDYIVEFGRSNVEFDPIFRTDKLLAPIDTSLEEIDLLDEGPISEAKLGYIYKKKISKNKEFFRSVEKHLVHTDVLQKIISMSIKFEGFEQVKEQLIKQLKWWIKVRKSLQTANLFVFGDQVKKLIDCQDHLGGDCWCKTSDPLAIRMNYLNYQKILI